MNDYSVGHFSKNPRTTGANVATPFYFEILPPKLLSHRNQPRDVPHTRLSFVSLAGVKFYLHSTVPRDVFHFLSLKDVPAQRNCHFPILAALFALKNCVNADEISRKPLFPGCVADFPIFSAFSFCPGVDNAISSHLAATYLPLESFSRKRGSRKTASFRFWGLDPTARIRLTFFSPGHSIPVIANVRSRSELGCSRSCRGSGVTCGTLRTSETVRLETFFDRWSVSAKSSVSTE